LRGQEEAVMRLEAPFERHGGLSFRGLRVRLSRQP
jgi:hypothetical protein